jgi:toxin ParE1/3/4
VIKPVRFSGAAEADLEAIGDWIAMDNPRRAISFIQELATSCKQIGQFPERFARVAGLTNIRKRVHGNYIICYSVNDKYVDILHVFHGSLDIEESDLFEPKIDDA